MKKEFSVNFLLISIYVLAVVFSLSHISAEITSGEEIQSQIGINPDDLSTDIDELKSKYLTQEWEELVNKNKFLGPVHRFLKSFFLIKILFGEQYSISITFFLIFIFWIFTAIKSGNIIKSSEIIRGTSAVIIGFLFSIVLAQTGIFNSIAVYMVSVIFSPEQWWMRLILGAIALAIILIIAYISALTEKAIKENKQTQKQSKSEQTQKELEAVSREIKK